MSKEKIVKLISSPTADQNTMAIKLAKWIEKDPSLLNLTFVRDKSILHLLVSANKPQVLNKLLQHPVWCAKALVGDKSGCTILHYAARHPEDLAMLLEILLQYVPTLLNIPNKKGNTPLHAAVLANQLWAVKALVKNKSIDRSLKNLEGKTAMSLAGMNNALKQALLHLELPAKQSPDLRLQPYSQSPDASLRKVFPFLSSGSESNDAISALSTLGSSHSFTTYATSSSGSYIASEAEEENEQEDSIYLAKMSRQLQELITSYKVEGHSPTYSLLQAQFNSSCELYALSDDFELKEITSDIAAAQAVISQTLDVLHPLVTESHKQIQHKMQSLLQMFTYLLAHNNLMADAEPRGALPTKPRPKADPLKEMPLDEILWLLTACQECINSKREFDESRLKNRVLSLLCAHQFVEILICLRMLYPALDHDQKTIANLIIVHLLFQHANDRIKLSPVINTHLRFIYKLNADKLGTLGEQINELLQQALEFASLLNKQPLLRNFYLLNQEISKIDHTKHNSSFDALVEQALSLSRTNRTQHVLLIAHELHMLTLSFYQHVSIHEFNKNNWLEQNRDERSPQIVAFTHCFNKLSAYFIKKILAQPTNKIQNALQFVLELFPILCSFQREKNHDMHSVMLLGSIFNNHAIARLTTIFAKLPSQDQERVAEINRMVSKENNCKYMRQMYSAYAKSLPFIGHLLSDITFANDGNKVDLVRLEVVGSLLKTLMAVKLAANFTRSDSQTNLPAFITHYEAPDEETIYTDSLRHQSREIDVIDLDNTTPDLESLFDNLEQNYLSKDILPGVLVKKTPYPPSQLANKLMAWFAKKLPTTNKAGKDMQETNRASLKEAQVVIKSFAKFKTLIEKIISINNTFYRTTELNPLFFAEHFKQLKQQVRELETMPKQNTDKIKRAHKHSLSKRMSLRFLDKNPLKQINEPQREFNALASQNTPTSLAREASKP